MEDSSVWTGKLLTLLFTIRGKTLVYTPLLTNLLEKAHAHGCPIVDGLGMLLHQARPGFHAWFGTDPEVDEDLRAFVLGS